VTRVTVATTDLGTAKDLADVLDELAAQSVQQHGGRFELQLELGAIYDSHAEHGRALASLLLAIHNWLDQQSAVTVDVTIDGRRFTLHGPNAGS
jgi:hypothetical protein